MKIIVDDLSGKEIADFLDEHIREMKTLSPPESKHALDLEGLRNPEITFWTVWDGQMLVGCGGLKELGTRLGEIKSVRTSSACRQKGVGSKLLQHMLDIAGERGYSRLSLETGSMEYFAAARKFYENFGFEYCEPFSDYILDPHSVFMTKVL